MVELSKLKKLEFFNHLIFIQIGYSQVIHRLFRTIIPIG